MRKKLFGQMKKVLVVILALSIIFMNMTPEFVNANETAEESYSEEAAPIEDVVSKEEESPKEEVPEVEEVAEGVGEADEEEKTDIECHESLPSDEKSSEGSVPEESEAVEVLDAGQEPVEVPAADVDLLSEEKEDDIEQPEAITEFVCICTDACVPEDIEENCPVCARALELGSDEEKERFLQENCRVLMEQLKNQESLAEESSDDVPEVQTTEVTPETETVETPAETDVTVTEETEVSTAAAETEESAAKETVEIGSEAAETESGEETTGAEVIQGSEDSNESEAVESSTEETEESKSTEETAEADKAESSTEETTETEETETSAEEISEAEETETYTEETAETEETETATEETTETEETESTEEETTETATETETEETEEAVLSGSVEQKASRWIFSKKVNMSYSLVVENQSENADAKDIEVTAVIPSIITIENGSDGADIDGQTVTWTIDEIEAGKKVKLSFSGYINENTDNVDNLNGRFYINGEKIEDVSFSGEWRLVESSKTEGPTSISTVCGGVSINVSAADNSVLPPGTQVRATRVSDDAVVEAIENSKEVVIKDVKAFDITLIVDGKEVQPDGSVVVTFSDIAMDTDNGVVEVAHVADSGNVEIMGNGSSNEASVETTHFSVYVLYSVDIEKTNVIKAAYESAGNVVMTTADGQKVPLAAFDFHIFAKTVTSGSHINGNIAANIFGIGHDFGNAGKFEVSGNDVVYLGYPMQNINTIKADYAVLGAFTKIVSYTNGSVTIICPELDGNGNVRRENGEVIYRNESYTLQITPEKCFIADEETVFLDIDRELENVSTYSKELGKLNSTEGVEFQKPEHVQRYELTVPVEKSGEDVVLNITWEQLRTYVESNDLIITTNGARSVVINVDMTDAPSDAVLSKSRISVDGRTTAEVNASYSTNVIWNFIQQESGAAKPFNGSLTLNDDYWNGTIVAPGATVNFRQVNGSIIASIANHGGGESHKSDVDLGGSGEFTVEKIWNDGLDSHPEIEVTLYVKGRDADGKLNGSKQKVTVDKDGNAVSNPLVFAEGSSDYVYTFTNLPEKDFNGYENVYFVEETKVPNGYTSYVNGGVITNTLINSKVRLRIIKYWENPGDGDKSRELTFNVYRKIDGGERKRIGTVNRVLQNSGESYTVQSGQDSMPDLWKYDAQRNEYIYEIEEVAINGYSVSTSVEKNGDEYVYKFTNTRITDGGYIDVKKTDDQNNKLAGAVFAIYQDQGCSQKAGEMVTDGNGYAKSGKLPEGTYYVKELTAPAGYAKTDTIFTVSVIKDQTAHVNNGAAVINRPVAQEVDPSFSVTKTVLGSPSVASTFTFRLYKDSVADQNLIDTQTITGSGSANFTSQKFTAVGTYIYKIVEEQGNEDGYSYDDSIYTVKVIVSENAGKLESRVEYTKDNDTAIYDTAAFENEYKPETISKTVIKIWDDNDNQDGIRPPEIKVQLKANGANEGNEIELNAGNNWSYTWENLPEKKDGQKVTYTVEEIGTVKGYTTSYSDDSFTITNSHTPGTVGKTVKKVWDDNSDQDGLRPESISVQLKANGANEGNAVELNAGNNWSYTWENLPEKKDGQKVTYTVEEIGTVKGYTTSYSDDSFTITNSHTPETVDVSGTKTWTDNNDQDGIRPESITVILWADGVKAAEKTVTEADGWSWTFEDLPKYKAGVEIVYAIEEIAVEGYEAVVTGFDVENTHIPGSVSKTVTKVWDDNNNQDGLRPESITVQLKANDENLGGAVVLNAENNWTYTWNNLDKMKDGQEVKYDVVEVGEVTGYITSYNVDGDIVTITNTHRAESLDINGHKIWDDNDNRDNLRPVSIVVNLLADGTQIDSRTVTEEDGWSWSFLNLPRYKAGVEISYTVTENVVDGYETVVNGYDITNRLIPETSTETEETESTTPETEETESTTPETEETESTTPVTTPDENGDSGDGDPGDSGDSGEYNPSEDNRAGVLGAIRGGAQGVLGAMRGVLGARVRTGDDSLAMAAVYVIFLAAAVAGIAIVTIRRKRAKKQ